MEAGRADQEKPWRALTALTPLIARILVRTECCGRSVRGDRVIAKRDPANRYWLRYLCVECRPELAAGANLDANRDSPER